MAGLAGLATGGIATAWCLISESEANVKTLSGWSGPVTRGKAAQAAAQAAGGTFVAPTKPLPKGKPKNPTNAGVKMYGRYPLADFDPSKKCTTTYSCEYGNGFDQICDNQRWGLDEVLGGTTPAVFHYDEGGNGNGRTKDRWRLTSNRNAHWYRSYNDRLNNAAGNRLRCEIDEFPLNSLKESMAFAKQALRAVDGNENGAQGNDWGYWLQATWFPCSTILGQPPPITWEVPTGTLPASDPRRTNDAQKVIAKYGFDSTSGLAPCYATYTPAGAQESPVPDHGFRVLRDDPLFLAHNWPAQNWVPDPLGLAANARPTSVNSAQWRRTQMPEERAAEATPLGKTRLQGDDDSDALASVTAMPVLD